MTGCKFSDGGWSWNESDSLNALGLIGSKFSDGGWSWNQPDSLNTFGLIVGKFSDSGWSWNEPDSFDALGLIESMFSKSSRSSNEADNLDIFMTFLLSQNVCYPFSPFFPSMNLKLTCPWWGKLSGSLLSSFFSLLKVILAIIPFML